MQNLDVSFGLHLPTRMLSGGDPKPASAQQLQSMVDSAADSGFSSIWVTDHIVYFDPWLDCMLFLAAVAGRAKERGLSIATGVIGLPLRHPVAMAQSFATLDILSGGNLIIGVGEGSTQSDFDALGIPFGQRRKMLEDGVVALRKLLTEQRASHQGPYYSFSDVTISPASLQRPAPPIWMSSWGSPAGIRRVARLADGWVASALHSTPEELGGALGRLNAVLPEFNKSPDEFPHAADTMLMYIDEDGDRARQVAAPIIEKAALTPFDATSGHYLVGSYEECQDILRRWVNQGARRICVWPVKEPLDQIKQFGERVLPGLF